MLPNHIALIPDGNRRWAKQKGLPAVMGHREGAKTAEKVLEAAMDAGIKYATFWGASISNVTKRDSIEVAFLFEIFEIYFKKMAGAEIIHKNKVQINVFGRWRDHFPKSCIAAIEKAIEATKDYNGLHLTFMLAYNGTEEMLTAINEIVANPPLPRPSGELTITAEMLKQHLYTKDLPPVDLVIRTGQDPHLSAGFMMWDVAEAQLYFSDKYWPDFGKEELQKALDYYANTERRLGK